ncbi:Helix-turn-helix domain protein [Haemophilus influenzae]|nr:Helix-turn-helix domain protein [Haemophilus influenzae]PRK31789.1 Helix-turn-helix domain protein [Haemophilus influenzae]PRK78114.1 Helix-turn-helix domain protein [Haemophilus influenzae]PRK95672.1 Helix-turn-helix domain protein [Haemophilus influenzae]PRK96985.1 Helix-turn-helix domain protein [Haemophilus influenzae]
MVYKIFLDLVIIIFIMKILTEKEKFSARLKLALSAMAMQNLKTSEIATKFNLQHPNESVTQQAVHKWLNGLAIPSMDKIETLSKWLLVKPEWLRYGVGDNEKMTMLDEVLLKMIIGLSEQQKSALIAFISSFQNKL